MSHHKEAGPEGTGPASLARKTISRSTVSRPVGMTCHTWDIQDKSAVAILLNALSTQQAHLCDRACSDPVKVAGSIHRVDLCQSCSQGAVCRRLQLRVVKWDAFKVTDEEEGKVKLLNLILK